MPSNRLATPFLFLPALLFWAAGAWAGEIGADLQAAIRTLDAGVEVSVVVSFAGEVDLAPFKGDGRGNQRAELVRALRANAERTQRPARAFLEGRGVSRVKQLWLINGLAVTAPPGVILGLAGLSGVERVELDVLIEAPETTPGVGAAAEWNTEAIRAPELWALGHTGRGVVVAAMDTGVDSCHPDLAGRWRGGRNSWLDPSGEHDAPYDRTGHGTQTMGLVVGGNAGGTAIGVAPDAQWIAVKIFNDAGLASLGAIHEGFQWLLDPDGDPDTDDAPDVVNNSWGLESNIDECIREFERDIETLMTAGIMVVFAAGNAGPSFSTSISPANDARSLAVGSVDQKTAVAMSSSRGPSACDGGIFPDLVAPGANVLTSDLTLGGVVPDPYSSVSGTSFAAPHVTGAAALLIEALPDVPVAEIESALEQSAVDLGGPGPDNAYGNGMVDVCAAYNLFIGNDPDTDSDGDVDGRDLAVFATELVPRAASCYWPGFVGFVGTFGTIEAL